MERIYNAALLARVPLALVQQVSVYEDERPGLDLAHDVLPVFALALALAPFPPLVLPVRLAGGEPGAGVIHELGPGLPGGGGAHEALAHGGPAVAAGQEAEAAVLGGGVLEGVPEAHGARRVRVQEGGVLVRGHGAADLGLLADDHGLQAARVAEAEGARDGGGVRLEAAGGDAAGARAGALQVRVQGRVEEGREGGRQPVQVVPDLVDGARLGLEEPAVVGGEGVLLEEEADLVARGEEVVVAHVVRLLARAEPRHGVVGQREVLQQRVRLGQERLHRRRGQRVGDHEVAVSLEAGELRGRETACSCWFSGHLLINFFKSLCFIYIYRYQFRFRRLVSVRGCR